MSEVPTVTFEDGSMWRRPTDTQLTYDGPLGHESWEWATAVECSAAWLAVCCH
jgi:hypothetical protein